MNTSEAYLTHEYGYLIINTLVQMSYHIGVVFVGETVILRRADWIFVKISKVNIENPARAGNRRTGIDV